MACPQQAFTCYCGTFHIGDNCETISCPGDGDSAAGRLFQQIPLDGRCQDCHQGSTPDHASQKTCVLNDPPCPDKCACKTTDALASGVNIECAQLDTLSAIPRKTKTLQLWSMSASSIAAMISKTNLTYLKQINPVILLDKTVFTIPELPTTVAPHATSVSATSAVTHPTRTPPASATHALPPESVCEHLSASSLTGIEVAICDNTGNGSSCNETAGCKAGYFYSPIEATCAPCAAGGYWSDTVNRVGLYSHCPGACEQCTALCDAMCSLWWPHSLVGWGGAMNWRVGFLHQKWVQ